MGWVVGTGWWWGVGGVGKQESFLLSFDLVDRIT